MDLSRRLADSLRRMRADAGLTQAEAARTLGLSRPTLTRLESASQNTTLRTLERLCRALRCDPGDLFRVGAVRLAARGRYAPGRRGRTS